MCAQCEKEKMERMAGMTGWGESERARAAKVMDDQVKREMAETEAALDEKIAAKNGAGEADQGQVETPAGEWLKERQDRELLNELRANTVKRMDLKPGPVQRRGGFAVPAGGVLSVAEMGGREAEMEQQRRAALRRAKIAELQRLQNTGEDGKPVRKAYRPGWIGRMIGRWVAFAMAQAMKPFENVQNALYAYHTEMAPRISRIIDLMKEQLSLVEAVDAMVFDYDKKNQFQVGLLLKAVDELTNRLGNVEAALKTLLEMPQSAELVDLTDEGAQMREYQAKMMREEGLSSEEAEKAAEEAFVQ